MQISDRLKTIADCVNRGNIVADIGCDHGLTSIYLIDNNIAAYVYAMDINDGPLKSAKANIRHYGFESNIELRISDGIKALDASDNVQTILISGMGGQLVIDILKELNNKPDVEKNLNQLVLSPQSDLHKVRQYLITSGYNIYNEIIIFDGGKYYNVICATPGKVQKYKTYEYKYGKILIEKRDAVFYEYLQNELKKKNNILLKIQTVSDSSERINETAKELKREINDINNILKMYT